MLGIIERHRSCRRVPFFIFVTKPKAELSVRERTGQRRGTKTDRNSTRFVWPRGEYIRVSPCIRNEWNGPECQPGQELPGARGANTLHRGRYEGRGTAPFAAESRRGL